MKKLKHKEIKLFVFPARNYRKKKNDLPKVTFLVGHRAGIETQAVWLPRLCSDSLTMHRLSQMSNNQLRVIKQ